MNTTYGTDIGALAEEALTYEGPDAYHGASPDELSEFMSARPDLWVPADGTSAWVALDGFDAALAGFLDAEDTLGEVEEAI